MRILASTLLLVVATGGRAQVAPLGAQNWQQADAATMRLKPAAFADLSTQVRQVLEQRGCTVPQTYANPTPHNVVRGRFTSAAQLDVAVLCSRERVSSILVFRGGSSTDVAELASSPDAEFLQGVGPGNLVGYSRSVASASPKYIQDHYDRYGGSKPPPLDHDGIDDGFDGKASVVWYWYGGRWLQLQGAD
jgi:hypothetical protein